MKLISDAIAYFAQQIRAEKVRRRRTQRALLRAAQRSAWRCVVCRGGIKPFVRSLKKKTCSPECWRAHVAGVQKTRRAVAHVEAKAAASNRLEEKVIAMVERRPLFESAQLLAAMMILAVCVGRPAAAAKLKYRDSIDAEKCHENDRAFDQRMKEKWERLDATSMEAQYGRPLRDPAFYAQGLAVRTIPAEAAQRTEMERDDWEKRRFPKSVRADDRMLEELKQSQLKPICPSSLPTNGFDIAMAAIYVGGALSALWLLFEGLKKALR